MNFDSYQTYFLLKAWKTKKVKKKNKIVVFVDTKWGERGKKKKIQTPLQQYYINYHVKAQSFKHSCKDN